MTKSLENFSLSLIGNIFYKERIKFSDEWTRHEMCGRSFIKNLLPESSLKFKLILWEPILSSNYFRAVLSATRLNNSFPQNLPKNDHKKKSIT